MSDYVSCPTCRGKGLIPLEEEQRITAHLQEGHDERQRAAWAHQVEMVRLDNELRLRSPEQAQKDAERRLADLKRRAGLSEQDGSAA